LPYNGIAIDGNGGAEDHGNSDDATASSEFSPSAIFSLLHPI